MSEPYITMAAKLVRAAPYGDTGDGAPTCVELERIGDLMRDAAIMLRATGDRERLLRKLVECEDILDTQREMGLLPEEKFLNDIAQLRHQIEQVAVRSGS